MLSSLSSGSSGPRPVISSRISETNSASSCVLSASRSASTYCDTSCWTWRRISSSGSFSSAERLISSISRRCRRTLASSSLSLSSGLAALRLHRRRLFRRHFRQRGPGRAVGRGRRRLFDRRRLGRGSASDCETAGHRLVLCLRVSFRTAALSDHALLRDGKLELLERRRGLLFRLRLAGRGIQHQLLELRGDLVAGLDLVERHAAVDRLAHQRVVVGDRRRRRRRRASARGRCGASRTRTCAARSG